MALVLKDRVKETSTTAGTGTITLAGAVAGFQSFSAVGNGNTTYYAIVDPTTGDWEVGIGTYTSSGTTLSRDTVLSSSNSGSLVSFVANQKDVFVTYPSEKSVYEDASNVVNATSFGAITATSAALTTGTVSTAPASGTDIANKTYVDTLVSSGITYHTPVKYEVPDSTGNLTATYNNGASGVGATLTNAGTLVAFTPDGTVATAGDRIIIYNQTNQFENGIYTVTTVGSGSVAWVLTRATDADTYALKSPNGLGNGDAFFITSGATGAGETYVCNTAGVITFGTTAITFAQISDSTLYTAGTGLTLTGTEFSITPTGTAGTYGSASSVPVLTTNASGQVTSVTNTTIAINGSQVSGNISGSAGSVANALTLGTYLTGGTYNGSAAVTATVDATSANTASKVVARDSSGNFSAGTITATLSGSATSATTATNLAGGAANQIAYQSASGTTSFATAPSASNQVLNWNGSAFTWSAGTISGVPLGSNLNSLTAGTYLTGTAYNGSAAQTWTVDATSANTASKVVARDASGNFSAGTITAALTGTASGNLPLTGGTLSGNLTMGSQVINFGGQSDSLGYNATAGLGMYIKGTGSTYIYGGGKFYDGATVQTLLQSGNYNSYAPTLTGTGASGTWNISITGSAGSAPGYLPLSGGTMTGTITGGSGVSDLVTGNYAGALRGYLYNDTSGFGLLTYAGSWAVRVDYGTNSVYIPGIGYSDASLRAPIFYDTNNTSYYLDPASSSVLNTIYQVGVYTRNSAGTGYLSGNYSSSETSSTTGAIYTIGGSYYPTSTSFNTMYGIGYCFADGISTGISGASGWGMYVNASGANNVWLGGNTGSVISTGEHRGTIFYDYSNTGYYVDPASTSRLGTVNADVLRSNTNVYTDQNYGYGLVGVYSSYRYQGVFAMGDAYKLPADGTTTGSLYGMAWSHPNAGGAAGNLNSHGLLLLQNGSFMAALSTNGTFSADVRGTIFYDYSNTGYYVDPASASYLYSLQLSGAAYFRPNSWIQFDGDYGIYSTAYNSAHFLANASSSYGAWRMIGSRGGYGGIYDTYSGVNGIMYDSAGNGGVYREANGRWYFYHNVSNNCTGFGTSTTNSAYNIYCPTGVYSGGRVDGTIFYDTNNTGYYVDPASTSILNVLNCYGNVTAYYSSDIKFKTNVRDIPNAIETVESIGGKLFDWTDEYLEEHGGEDPYFMRKEDFGVVAQDVLKVFPVAVRTRPDGSLAVDYEKLSALAFAAVAELSNRVKSLEARI